MIQRGDADVVLAGGTEAALTGLCLAAFKRMGAIVAPRRLVARSTRAATASSWARARACSCSSREEHAQARGATHPRADRRLRRVQRRVPHDPARPRGPRRRRPRCRARSPTPAPSPSDVGYINAHGTSTPINDRVEARRRAPGLQRLARRPCPRPKSPIGHLLGAAGAVEAVATLGAIERGMLPPTINFERARPRDATSSTSTARARRTGRARAVELVRLRRPERLPGNRRA